MSTPGTAVISINKAKAALRSRFEEIKLEVGLNCDGYTSCIQDNLIDGVRMKDFCEEMQNSPGNELTVRKNSRNEPVCTFMAVHSSAALMANCFAPFKDQLSSLYLLDNSGFEKFEFEKRCSTGLKTGMAPHLDAVVVNQKFIIGIESKLTEHLKYTKPKNLCSYLNACESENKHWCSKWFEAMKCLHDNPKTYRYLDAAQLIKHAFGMSNAYESFDKTKVLLYVYWKPSNAQHYKKFEHHCEDIEELSNRLDGATPKFMPISYRELWDEWDNKKTNGDWLKKHVANLRERYEVEVQDAR